MKGGMILKEAEEMNPPLLSFLVVENVNNSGNV
jgi:hypothetical protein